VPPDSIPGYAPPAGVAYDPAGARDLLDQTGYSSADFPVVEILCTFNDERIVQALARMWRETLGVRVDIRTQESKTLAQDKAGRRYLIARGNWYADYTDPTTFLNCHVTGDGNNDSGYANPDYDALIACAERAVDRTERMSLLAEAEALLIERDCPVMPILHYAQLLAVKPHVQGLHANARLWFPFQYVSVQR
jgi:oligopeptide transport system substrate-binding protein